MQPRVCVCIGTFDTALKNYIDGKFTCQSHWSERHVEELVGSFYELTRSVPDFGVSVMINNCYIVDCKNYMGKKVSGFFYFPLGDKEKCAV